MGSLKFAQFELGQSRREVSDWFQRWELAEGDRPQLVDVLLDEEQRKANGEVVTEQVAWDEEELFGERMVRDEAVLFAVDFEWTEFGVGADERVDVVQGELEEVLGVRGEGEAVLEQEFGVVVGAVGNEDLGEAWD